MNNSTRSWNRKLILTLFLSCVILFFGTNTNGGFFGFNLYTSKIIGFSVVGLCALFTLLFFIKDDDLKWCVSAIACLSFYIFSIYTLLIA